MCKPTRMFHASDPVPNQSNVDYTIRWAKCCHVVDEINFAHGLPLPVVTVLRPRLLIRQQRGKIEIIAAPSFSWIGTPWTMDGIQLPISQRKMSHIKMPKRSQHFCQHGARYKILPNAEETLPACVSPNSVTDLPNLGS